VDWITESDTQFSEYGTAKRSRDSRRFICFPEEGKRVLARITRRAALTELRIGADYHQQVVNFEQIALLKVNQLIPRCHRHLILRSNDRGEQFPDQQRDGVGQHSIQKQNRELAVQQVDAVLVRPARNICFFDLSFDTRPEDPR
jgi:hypothetical protein